MVAKESALVLTNETPIRATKPGPCCLDNLEANCGQNLVGRQEASQGGIPDSAATKRRRNVLSTNKVS